MFLSQGAADAQMFDDIHPRYEHWLKMYGFAENHVVRAVGVREAGEVQDQKTPLEEARKLALALVGGSVG